MYTDAKCRERTSPPTMFPQVAGVSRHSTAHCSASQSRTGNKALEGRNAKADAGSNATVLLSLSQAGLLASLVPRAQSHSPPFRFSLSFALTFTRSLLSRLLSTLLSCSSFLCCSDAHKRVGALRRTSSTAARRQRTSLPSPCLQSSRSLHWLCNTLCEHARSRLHRLRFTIFFLVALARLASSNPPLALRTSHLRISIHQIVQTNFALKQPALWSARQLLQRLHGRVIHVPSPVVHSR